MGDKIVILDGVNGTGKSTSAKVLRELTGWPIIRAFRDDSDSHLGYNAPMEDDLRKLGVPVNTYVDDLYVADFLRATRRGAILDRSMPSALAYPMMRGEECMTPKVAKKLVVLWEEILRAAKIPVVYIWMQASYDVVKERCADRWYPKKAQYDKLESVFKKVFMTLGLCKKRVVTTELSENETIKSVRWVVDNGDDR